MIVFSSIAGTMPGKGIRPGSFSGFSRVPDHSAQSSVILLFRRVLCFHGDDVWRLRGKWQRNYGVVDAKERMAMRTAVSKGRWSQLLSSIFSVLHAWWMTDRIRVPESSGRLLTLQPGKRFVCHGRVWFVMTREVKCQDGAAWVKYRLHADGDCSAGDSSAADLEVAELLLSLDQEGRTAQFSAVLSGASETNFVTDTDVTILNARRSDSLPFR